MKRTIALIAAFVLALPAITAAQRPRPPDREQLDEKIQTLRIWKMTDFLDLDAETSARLFPLMQKYEDQIRDLEDAKWAHGDRVRRIIEGEETVDQAEVNRMIDDWFAIDRQILDLKHQEYKAVSKVLDPLRMIKFIAFEARFQEEINRIIFNIRHGDRGGRGMGPGSGPLWRPDGEE